MIAVPLTHRLTCRDRLSITDLYGETLMMVKRGDSALNDRLRDDLEQNHPQIQIEDTPLSVSYTHLDVYKRQVFLKRMDGRGALPAKQTRDIL